MNLSISFRNAADPDPHVVAHVERRARSLAAILDDQNDQPRLRVICGSDAGWADTEVIARIDGRQIVARAEDADVYEAIDCAFDRLDHHIAHEREKNASAARRRRFFDLSPLSNRGDRNRSRDGEWAI